MAGDMNAAWETVTGVLCGKQAVGSNQELCSSVKILHEHDLAVIIEEWFFEYAQEHLRSTVAPAFWSLFQQPVAYKDVVCHVKTVFQKLYNELSSYWPCLDRLDYIKNSCGVEANFVDSCVWKKFATPKDYMLLLFKAILFNQTTKAFQDAINSFYFQAFKAYDATTKADIDDMDESEEESREESSTCAGCDKDKVSCCCDDILAAFHQLNTQLRELGLLERLSGETVTLLIHQRIKQHIESTCRGNFEVEYISPLNQWLETKVVGWLELLYRQPDTNPSSDEVPQPVATHKDRLYHYMYEIYGDTRIAELFDIIVEIPESEPALLDLKSCLEKTSLRPTLVQSLRYALETRLLHPGVNTSDILTAYISAIRGLRILDPTGVLLDLVCEPVRKYLRNREDTVRCIVSSLTEDGNNDLSDELVKGEPLVLDESYHSDEDTDHWESWMPDPVDADPAKSSSRRSSDIISMLVNIYGSKELFVNEYRTLLADRILTNFNYDTEKEIRYLELLKLRFGEAQLHFCEVMLKDVADSKRINTRIVEQREKAAKDEVEGDIPMNAMILSAQFWPTFREEKVSLPEDMKTSLEKYTKGFETLKGNRTLNWKPHLGLVNIEIELKDKTLNLNVSPVHATILWHFQEQSLWTVEELSSVIHMPAHGLRRKIAFWQSHGLLKEETTDTFVLVEEHKGHAHDGIVLEEEEAESAMASAKDQKEEELQVIWQYVVGMLTNLETLPIDRIHSMLKMYFAMQGPGSECSIHELKAFLDKKVKDQKLLYLSGVYRLPKPGS